LLWGSAKAGGGEKERERDETARYLLLRGASRYDR